MRTRCRCLIRWVTVCKKLVTSGEYEQEGVLISDVVAWLIRWACVWRDIYVCGRRTGRRAINGSACLIARVEERRVEHVELGRCE